MDFSKLDTLKKMLDRHRLLPQTVVINLHENFSKLFHKAFELAWLFASLMILKKYA